MKVKLTLVSLVGLLGVAAAVAAPAPGKGKPPATGPGCKPRITVVLKGALVGTPGPGATSLRVDVKSGNRWARAYVAAAQPTSIGVTPDTKVRRRGKKALGDLRDRDRVLVQAKACKQDLAEDATPPLVAVRVVAHPAAS
jgi:hypothetical protein